MSGNHIVTAVIDKLRIWCNGVWRTYDTNCSKLTNLILRIHYDQLFILSSHNRVLESLNLNEKMKCIYKHDVVILIICNSLQQIRKIKFQIKTNLSECLYKLGLHFPVVNYNSNHSLSEPQSKYRNFEEVLKTVLDDKGAMSGTPLPPSFKEFVKLCLLDPTFPQVVIDTEDILKELDVIK